MLGALPMGWLADRYRRGRAHRPGPASSSRRWSCLSGLAVNAFTSSSPGSASASPSRTSCRCRARCSPTPTRSASAAGSRRASPSPGAITGTLSPLLVGGIAALAGGERRLALGVLRARHPGRPIVAFFAFRIPEPPRGQFEKKDVLGEVIEDERPAPISMEAAFSRLMQIRTIRMTIIAFAAMGFGLFTGARAGQPVPRGRSTASARSSAACVGHRRRRSPCSPRSRSSATYYDRLLPPGPATGAPAGRPASCFPSALLTPIQYFMPNPVAVRGPRHPAGGAAARRRSPWWARSCSRSCPTGCGAWATALGAIYIFFIGATGGALLAALLHRRLGPRAAVIAARWCPRRSSAGS